MTSVSYLAAAEEELNAAAAFYEAQASGLGLEFLDEVEAVEQRARANPALGAPYAAGTRRLLLNRFPFGFIYRERSNNRLEVVALMHLRRHPEYWRHRI